MVIVANLHFVPSNLHLRSNHTCSIRALKHTMINPSAFNLDRNYSPLMSYKCGKVMCLGSLRDQQSHFHQPNCLPCIQIQYKCLFLPNDVHCLATAHRCENVFKILLIILFLSLTKKRGVLR